MNKRKILTLEDLYLFCVEQNMFSFNSHESNKSICVQVPSSINYDKSYDDGNLLIANIKAFHVGRNRNGSSVTKEAAENAIKNLAYKPVLANFMINPETGEEDFTAHDMKIEEDGSITYIERQVGCFTADEAEIKFDKETEKEFVFAKIAIPREYTNAADIIERKNGTKVSVELNINDLSYDAKNKMLLLNDVDVSGVTLLGTNPETLDQVEEGMLGARVSLEDFSKTNNSMFVGNNDDEKLIKTFRCYLDKVLESFDKAGKEDDDMNKDEQVFDEVIDENNMADEQDADNVNINDNNDFEEDSDENKNDEVVESEFNSDESNEDETNTLSDADETNEDNDSTDEIQNENDEVKEFSKTFELKFDISHNEIEAALYGLICRFEEEDNDYYFIESVYDDYFIMRGWFNKTFYGMKYEKNDNIVSLSGERWHLNYEFLTDEELENINNMRANYEILEEKVSKYEKDKLDAEKDSIFNNENYSRYLNEKEFTDLIHNKDNYSVDELKEKAKAAFGSCIIRLGSFVHSSNVPSTRKQLGSGRIVNSEEKPYGNLFDD